MRKKPNKKPNKNNQMPPNEEKTTNNKNINGTKKTPTINRKGVCFLIIKHIVVFIRLN